MFVINSFIINLLYIILLNIFLISYYKNGNTTTKNSINRVIPFYLQVYSQMSGLFIFPFIPVKINTDWKWIIKYLNDFICFFFIVAKETKICYQPVNQSTVICIFEEKYQRNKDFCSSVAFYCYKTSAA